MSLSLKLPLKLWTDGFASFEDSETIPAIRQNLKMLLLTNPGEYAMDPDFGVGMVKFLFSQESTGTREAIKAKTIQQARKYMPYISITSVDYDLQGVENNAIGITIHFLVRESELPEVFNLNVTL
jgi:phage baseplate assembly protein W